METRIWARRMAILLALTLTRVFAQSSTVGTCSPGKSNVVNNPTFISGVGEVNVLYSSSSGTTYSCNADVAYDYWGDQINACEDPDCFDAWGNYTCSSPGTWCAGDNGGSTPWAFGLVQCSGNPSYTTPAPVCTGQDPAGDPTQNPTYDPDTGTVDDPTQNPCYDDYGNLVPCGIVPNSLVTLNSDGTTTTTVGYDPSLGCFDLGANSVACGQVGNGSVIQTDTDTPKLVLFGSEPDVAGRVCHGTTCEGADIPKIICKSATFAAGVSGAAVCLVSGVGCFLGALIGTVVATGCA